MLTYLNNAALSALNSNDLNAYERINALRYKLICLNDMARNVDFEVSA